jgi:hypothetical protein
MFERKTRQVVLLVESCESMKVEDFYQKLFEMFFWFFLKTFFDVFVEQSWQISE